MSVRSHCRASTRRSSGARLGRVCAVLGAITLAAGCHTDMYDQVKHEPLEPSVFFADGLSSRPLEAGVVPRGSLPENEAIGTGRTAGGKEFVAEIPLPVTADLLARGEERFGIYCTPCHGQAGYGDGMIVQRGFRRPPSYHTEALRTVADGRMFDVVSNGFGSMPRFRDRIGVRDRWAIVAYVRALQLSQNAVPGDLTAEERAKLDAKPSQVESTPDAPSSAPGGAR